jgi:hypothetical protein
MVIRTSLGEKPKTEEVFMNRRKVLALFAFPCFEMHGAQAG